jgi:hypothetical protein
MPDIANRNDAPSKKKIFYPIKNQLKNYLIKYDREVKLPVQYSDMLRFTYSSPLFDKNGKDTLWQTVVYNESEMEELHPGLKFIYALMNASGHLEVMQHLSVSRIDYCTFGNSRPFRVRIINRLNDNYDHFYVKVADASRVYGLELEHILSPNRINYLTDGNTLIEEHIAGLPGDLFLQTLQNENKFNQIRICKEFVKFNERCFVRLLGDMRSYNFVVDITPDIEGNQYRIRAIDFDQQSYEGRLNLYLPHYFKENNPLVFLGLEHITEESMRQYQQEERSLIGHREKLGRARLKELFEASLPDEVAPVEKTTTLAKQLAVYHKDDNFLKIKHMGKLVLAHLYKCLEVT